MWGLGPTIQGLPLLILATEVRNHISIVSLQLVKEGSMQYQSGVSNHLPECS